ncbi:non-canonical purine NTP pyrophosphatase [Anaeromyxobacter paludicola]|nr:non-canonical purine NTP pyrophosphatase [Anaeromyxobacter paludicola]
MDLFFGSTNPGKLRELRRLVAGLPVRVISPEDLGRPLPEVVEDGATFRANAEKKAAAFARFAGTWAVADDSGLCVDALGGRPGVHSARWSELEPLRASASPACALGEAGLGELGPEASRGVRDELNNDKLLEELAGLPDDRRGAAYVAVLALARSDGTIHAAVEGACRGRIGLARRGQGGFGYDPLFVPERGSGPGELTMAELAPEEKDALSHRGRAFRMLRPLLGQLAFDKSERQG